MRLRVPLAWVIAVAVVVGACGGSSGWPQEQDLLAGLASDVPLEQLGLRDPECPGCPPQVALKSLQPVATEEALRLMSADSVSADLLAMAGEKGLGAVVGGVQATYQDESGWVMALLDTRTAGVISGSGTLAGSFLVEYDPAAGMITFSDRQGHLLAIPASGELSSWDAHNSCRYWHCVSAVVAMLLYDPEADALSVRGECADCVQSGQDPVYDLDAEATCEACLVRLAVSHAPVVLSATIACSEDACRWCLSPACGVDQIIGYTCQENPNGEHGTAAPWVLLENYNEYYCSDPGNYQACTPQANARLVEECWWGCAPPDARASCLPPYTCDRRECEQSRPVGSPVCEYRPDQGVVATAQDYEEGQCMPDDHGGETCVTQRVTRVEPCPYGCSPDGQSCAARPGCSASELAASLQVQFQDLPAAVSATRMDILRAAANCDYEALAELASFPGFAYLVGEAGDTPVAYWQSLEESGTGTPLRDMLLALTLPVEGTSTGGTQVTYYYWSDGPGGATEYRLGIAADGRWLFFLADD